MADIESLEYRLKNIERARARRAADLAILHTNEALGLMKDGHHHEDARKFRSEMLRIIADAQDL